MQHHAYSFTVDQTHWTAWNTPSTVHQVESSVPVSAVQQLVAPSEKRYTSVGTTASGTVSAQDESASHNWQPV